MNSPNARTWKDAVSFLAVVVIFQAVGAFLGWLTQQDIDDWYNTLIKSPLNPPNPVFGIVWTILYLVLAVSAWLIWKAEPSRLRTVFLGIFVAHMVLNWAWTPLFFTLHMVMPAFALIVVLALSGGLLVLTSLKIDKRVATMLIPYIAWLCFAGHLTFYIALHNF